MKLEKVPVASPSRDMKCVWFLAEGRLLRAGKLLCRHPSCPQSCAQCSHTLLCVCPPALLSCVPFLIYSAACLDLLLCTVPASCGWCEKGSVSWPSIISSRLFLYLLMSPLLRCRCGLCSLSVPSCAASDTQVWLLS